MKQIINKMFNKNIRLRYIISTKHFLYLLSIFIIYKYTLKDAVKKARSIIDLRSLNNIAESNIYLLFLQKNILTALTYTN